MKFEAIRNGNCLAVLFHDGKAGAHNGEIEGAITRRLPGSAQTWPLIILNWTTKRAALFSPLAFLETAAKGRVLMSYRKGAIAFEQGEPANAVFYIKSGKVKIINYNGHIEVHNSLLSVVLKDVPRTVKDDKIAVAGRHSSSGSSSR